MNQSKCECHECTQARWEMSKPLFSYPFDIPQKDWDEDRYAAAREIQHISSRWRA